MTAERNQYPDDTEPHSSGRQDASSWDDETVPLHMDGAPAANGTDSLPSSGKAAAKGRPGDGGAMLNGGGYLQAPGQEEDDGRGLLGGERSNAGSIEVAEEGRASNLKAAGTIFIGVVGAGVLGLPYAFAQAGLAVGIGFLTLVAALALYCMLLLAQCKRALEHEDVVSYGEVVQATLGGGGQRLVEALLIISQTGFCTAYLVFIKENLASFTGQPANACVAALLPFLLALSTLRGVASLAPFSLVADAANAIGFAVVLFDDAVVLTHNHPHVSAAQSLSRLPYLFGVAVYAFEGVGMVLPIEASMASRAHFDAVLSLTMGGITLLYIGFGLVGYLAFGPETQDIITFNLPQNWTTTAVKLSLCVGLFFTFSPMMIPVYQIVERGLAGKAWFRQKVPQPRRWAVFRACRAALVLCVAAAAAFVPGFGFFISLIGSLACSVLSFVIPAMSHLALFRDSMPRWQLWLNYFLIVFGLVGAVVGVADSAYRLLHGDV